MVWGICFIFGYLDPSGESIGSIGFIILGIFGGPGSNSVQLGGYEPTEN